MVVVFESREVEYGVGDAVLGDPNVDDEDVVMKVENVFNILSIDWWILG